MQLTKGLFLIFSLASSAAFSAPVTCRLSYFTIRGDPSLLVSTNGTLSSENSGDLVKNQIEVTAEPEFNDREALTKVSATFRHSPRAENRKTVVASVYASKRSDGRYMSIALVCVELNNSTDASTCSESINLLTEAEFTAGQMKVKQMGLVNDRGESEDSFASPNFSFDCAFTPQRARNQ